MGKEKEARQLEQREAIRLEREMRRQTDLQRGICRTDGLLVGAPLNELLRIPVVMKQHESIAEANWDDLDKPFRHSDGTLRLALEFCPIYSLNTSLTTSHLDVFVPNEQGIISSRVGMKWIATKECLTELNKVCQKFETKLELFATFADIGVLTERRMDTNPEILIEHENLYRKLLGEICDSGNIGLNFRKLSEIAPISVERNVDQFVISSDGKILDSRPTVEELLPMLGFIEGEIPLNSGRQRNRANVLLSLLDGCNGNIDVLRGLLNTYINYPTTKDCDMHLSVERGGSLCALQVLHSQADSRQIPKLNIIVK
ncbi:MAG TPA: hypothetical protein VMR41_05825 [Patescibacteria group bacterium]|nr:hypothetical protein [Patescibacteria group bacterium]